MSEYVRRTRQTRRTSGPENLRLEWSPTDPADRTIVATARLRGLPILTKDRIVRDFYPVQGWRM
ncbi:MAG TPA: hypothetical protein ENN03_06420 [bacterium]|nr:hypothetical protein [bacterium]